MTGCGTGFHLDKYRQHDGHSNGGPERRLCLFRESHGSGVFASGVSFACANLPALTGCVFSPASIAAGAATTSVMLTISTTGPNSGTESQSRMGKCCARLRPFELAQGSLSRTPDPTRAPDPTLPFLTLGWVDSCGHCGGQAQEEWGKSHRQRSDPVGISLGLGLMAIAFLRGSRGGGDHHSPATSNGNRESWTGRTLFADETGNTWAAGATQQQFRATVNGATNQSVAWAVTGGSTNGSVDGSGLYTAPAIGTEPGDSDRTATSAAGATKLDRRL